MSVIPKLYVAERKIIFHKNLSRAYSIKILFGLMYISSRIRFIYVLYMCGYIHLSNQFKFHDEAKQYSIFYSSANLKKHFIQNPLVCFSNYIMNDITILKIQVHYVISCKFTTVPCKYQHAYRKNEYLEILPFIYLSINSKAASLQRR